MIHTLFRTNTHYVNYIHNERSSSHVVALGVCCHCSSDTSSVCTWKLVDTAARSDPKNITDFVYVTKVCKRIIIY